MIDAPFSCVDHGGEECANGPVHGFDVQVEAEIPVLVRALEDVAVVDVTGAVEQHVERAGGRGERVDIGGIQHVQACGAQGRARSRVAGEFGEGAFVDIGCPDVGAFGGEHERGSPSDAFAGRRHHDVFAFDTLDH